MPILVQRTSRRRQWVGVAVMAAFIAGGYWLSRPDPPPALPESPSTPPDGKSFTDLVANGSPASAAAGASAAAAVASAALPDTVPEGLSAQDWKELQEALKDHPQRDAELARIVELLRFQARVQRFQQLSATPGKASEPDTQALARSLLEQLPDHVGNHEVSPDEATALADTILGSLHADPAQRDRERAAVRQRIAQAVPGPVTLPADDRAARYASAEAAEIQRWNALPPERRDPYELETRLEALRRSILGEDPAPKGPVR